MQVVYDVWIADSAPVLSCECMYAQAEIRIKAGMLKEVLAWQRDGSFRAASLASQKRAVQRNSGIKAWHAR